MEILTREELLAIPREMRTTWEIKNLQDRTLAGIEREIHTLLFGPLTWFLWAALIISFLAGVVLGNRNVVAGNWFLIPLAIMGAVWVLIERRRRRMRTLMAILAWFEEELEDNGLNLRRYVKERYSFEAMQTCTQYRLIWAAQNILIVQDEVARKRKDLHCPEDDLETSLVHRRQFIADFNQMLERARDFGLRPKERAWYFKAADEKLKKGEFLNDDGQPRPKAA